MNKKLKIKKLDDRAIIPTKGSEYSAGFDLYCMLGDAEERIIWAHDTHMINTGIAVEIPRGYFGAIFARSGLASRQGLRPANCVGVIDSDYRGEIMVALHNDMKRPQRIHNHDRIAQLVIIPYAKEFTEFEVIDDLEETDRGSGGFGSTGK